MQKNLSMHKGKYFHQHFMIIHFIIYHLCQYQDFTF